MICPNCQTQNPEAAKFCFNCGTELALLCPQCGTELPSGAKFCFNCGHQLAAGHKAGGEDQQSPATAASAPSTFDRFIPPELASKLEAARTSQSMEGERRVVTMLFCDIVGSTASARQLDPEEWTEIVNGAFEHMIQPVYTYEGTVGRLMGDAILAFFGAPIAHEDDPQRAILAGLGIVSRIAEYRQAVQMQWGVSFDVRVGINTGLVVVGAVGSDLRMEYTAMGDAINVAARMEQTARPGAVQIAEETYKQVYPFFELRDIGGIQVKGQERPIQAYEVLGRKGAPGRLRGIEGLDAPLIGRQRESGQLAEALEELKKGLGGIVCLTGEAGLGKSRLISELHDLSRAESTPRVQWQQSVSLSYETEQPYGLFQRLIRRTLDLSQGERPQIQRERIASFAGRMPSEESGRLRRTFESLFGLPGENGEPPLEGEAFKGQLYSVMTALWRFQASQQPMILVFDDVHWSDLASVELLMHLLPITERLPLLLVCAMRPDRQAPGWKVKLKAETEYPHRYREIALKPLSASDSEELVDHLLAISDLPPRLRARILDKSEGNPFFVEEVVRTLIDQGIVVRDAGGSRWQATSDGQAIDIPGNLQTLLMARIDRLEEDVRQTLQLASVVGRSFYFRVLERIAEAGQALDRQLLTLQRTEMIQELTRIPELEYIFRHTLTQEAAYNTILLRQRRAFHRRVAEAIEALFPEKVEEMAATLAFHFYHARDHERALHYYTAAGDSAFRLYALSEAIDHYGRAITCAEAVGAGGDRWVHLYTRLGRALELSDRFDEARENYQQLAALGESLGDRSLNLASLIALGTLFSTHTPLMDLEQGRVLSEEALDLARALGDQRGESKALWNLLLNTNYGSGTAMEAREYGEASLAIARELGWIEQMAYTLNDLAFAYSNLGQPHRSLEVLAESRTRWREMGNLPMLSDNLNVTALLSYLTGDTNGAIDAAEEGYEIALTVGNIWNQMAIKANNAVAYRDRGDYAQAIQDLENVISTSQELNVPERSMMALLYLPILLTDMGQIEAGLEQCRQSAAALEQLPVAIRRTYGIDDLFLAVQARLHLLAGDLTSAQKAIEQIQYEVTPVFTFPYADVHIFPIFSEVTLKLKHFDRVLATCDLYTARLQEAGLRASLPDVYYYRALALEAIGETEAAREALRGAYAEAEMLSSRHCQWRILAGLALIEDEAGNTAAAEKLRRQAQEPVQYIAAHAGSPERRSSFLALVSDYGL